MRPGRRSSIRFTVLFSAFIAAVSGWGCGSSSTPTTPSTTTTSYSLTTQFFNGTLSPGGTAVNPMAVTLISTVSLALVSLTDGSNIPLPSTLSLSLGTPATGDSTICNPMQTRSTAVSLTNVTTEGLPTGSYCVSLKDTGSLTTAANFTVRITTVLGSIGAVPGATTDTFSTFLQPGATALTTVMVSSNSTLAVTLTNSGTPSLVLGLTVGSWDGATCHTTRTLTTTAGTSPQISLLVDPGTYCVQVSDVGHITTNHITFSASITHS